MGLILGVPRHIEPVAAPTFAVMGRRQQPIDDLLIRIGRLIAEIGLDVLGRGGQSDQIKRQPADQCRAVRRSDRL